MVGRQIALVIAHQLEQLLRKIVGCRGTAVALQGEGGELVAARRTADAEIDAAGMHAGEHAEALRHLERAVMRQHDAAAADPHMRGRPGDGADQHLGAAQASMALA